MQAEHWSESTQQNTNLTKLVLDVRWVPLAAFFGLSTIERPVLRQLESWFVLLKTSLGGEAEREIALPYDYLSNEIDAISLRGVAIWPQTGMPARALAGHQRLPQ